MTPNRLAAIAFRWSISAVLALWVFSPNAQAQSAATSITGVYNGTYTCAIGPRTLKLSLLASGNGSLTGVFTFYLPPTSHTEAFSYSLSGTFEAASGKFKLNPVKWETPPPGGYVMVGMDGAFDPGTGQVAGKITNGSCGAFQATRDQAASANIASVVAPQKAAGAAQPLPKTAAAPPARPLPTAAATQGGATSSSASVVQTPAMRTPPVPSPSRPQAPAEPSAAEIKAALPPPAPPNGLPPASTLLAQAEKPCSLLTKAEAESIVGASLVVRRDSNEECWFVEDGFTNPTGPRNRQVYLNIWHSATPQSDDVNTTRASIAARQRTAATVIRDVPDFADAALWTWNAGWGRFDAFKGGTIGVDVIVGGIAENAALQNAKKLAALKPRLLS